MKKIKNYLINLLNFEKPKIIVKNIELKTPYVLIIDFTSTTKKGSSEMYLVIHGDYRKIRSKFLKRQTEQTTNISFMEYKEEIGLLIPIEDVVKSFYKLWIEKPTNSLVE